MIVGEFAAGRCAACRHRDGQARLARDVVVQFALHDFDQRTVRILKERDAHAADGIQRLERELDAGLPHPCSHGIHAVDAEAHVPQAQLAIVVDEVAGLGGEHW